MSKPILVFGYGNPSRGDDAVGPLLLEHLERQLDLTHIELLSDFQLQIEHALDLLDRKRVLFVDASVACHSAFELAELAPLKDNSYSTHAMSPAALLHVYRTVSPQPPPPAFLLSIQASDFELGAALSPQTADNLKQASRFAGQLLNDWSLSVGAMR